VTIAPISPELVLVDPDLAARARALLPEPGCFVPASRAAGVAPVPTVGRHATASRRSRRRRPPLRRAAWALAGSAAVATGALWITRLHERAPAVEAGPVPNAAVLHARAARQARTAHTYIWPSVPGAARYHVVLRRGALPVYEASTASPRLDLPRGLRLTPGRYTWVVALAGGVPAARPLVEETFRVDEPER
jgi:hypothetical protein